MRTAESAREIINRLLASELAVLERDPIYQGLLKAIEERQQPILDRIAGGIRDTLTGFLPSIEEVSLEPMRDVRTRTLRTSTDVVINDGTRTSLKDKGDGVQSLVALGVLRHASELRAGGRSVILALEEPESHLHPHAIHVIRRVIQDLSAHQQVIVTTHSPLFVNIADVSSNIVVHRNQAKAARSIAQIRNVLGVQAYDSLVFAEMVLVVEGNSDRKALSPILREMSQVLTSAFDDNRLVIYSLGGSGNLVSAVRLIVGTVCQVRCFLDDDAAGRDVGNAAINKGVLPRSHVSYTICQGRTESEIEDLYDPKVYAERVAREFGPTVTVADLQGSKEKWSGVMARLFKEQGYPWNKSVEDELKDAVADEVAGRGACSLWSRRRSSIEALVSSLERLVSQQDG